MVMADDDDDSENDCLLIDESRTGSPMNGQNDVNIPATNTEQPNGIENPINCITLMQNFEKIRNIPNNFPSSQNISNQKKIVDANQAHKPRIACKDFSRKPFSTNSSSLLHYLPKDTTNLVGTIPAQITDVSNEDTPKGSGNIHSEDTSIYLGNRHNEDTPRGEGNSHNFNNLQHVDLLESPIRPPTSVYVPKPPSSASLKADNPFDDSASVNTSLIQKDPRPNTDVEHHIDCSTMQRHSTVITHQPPDYEAVVATAGRQAATYSLATVLKTAHKNGYLGLVGHQSDQRIAANPNAYGTSSKNINKWKVVTAASNRDSRRKSETAHPVSPPGIVSLRSVIASPQRKVSESSPTAGYPTQVSHQNQRHPRIATTRNMHEVTTANNLASIQDAARIERRRENVPCHQMSLTGGVMTSEPVTSAQKQVAENLSGGYLAQIEHLNQRDPRTATNINFQGVTRENNIGPIRAAARIAQRRKSVPAPPIRQAATNSPTALSKNVRQTQIGYEPQRDSNITTNINVLDVPIGNTLPPTQGTVNMVAHLRSTLETTTYLGPMAPTQIQATHAATTSGMNGYPVPIGHQTHIDSSIATNMAVCGNLPFIQGVLSVDHHQAGVTSHPGTLSGTTGYVYGQAANTLPTAMSVNSCLPQTRTDLAAHEREVYNNQSLLFSKRCRSVIMSTPEGQRYCICKPECSSRKGTIAHYYFNLQPPANTLPVPRSSVVSCNIPREPSLYPNIHPGVPISNNQPNRWSEPNPAHNINPDLLHNPIYRYSEVDSSTYLATNISPTHVNTPGRSDTLNMTPTNTANIQKRFDTINCKPTPNRTVITKSDSEKKTRKEATKTLTKMVKSIKSKKFEFNPQDTQNEVKITQSSLNQVILNNNGTNINNTEVSKHSNINIAQTCVTDSSNSLILSPNTTQKEQTDACTHSNKMDGETKLALLHADIDNLKTVVNCMTNEVQSNAIKIDDVQSNCDIIDIEAALDFIESDTARPQTGVTEATITILPSTDFIQNVQINDTTQQASIKTNIEADLNFTQISDTAVVLLPYTTQKFEIDDVAQKANNKIDNKDKTLNLVDSKTDLILTGATQASNKLLQSPNTTQTIEIDNGKHESNNKLCNETKLVLLDSNADRTQTKVPRNSDGVIKSLDTIQNVQATALTQNPINYIDIEARKKMLHSNIGRDQKDVMIKPLDQTMNVTQNVEANAFKQQIINDTDVKTAETLLLPNAGSEQTNVTLKCNAHILSTNALQNKATPTSTTTKTSSHKPTNNGFQSTTCTKKGDVNFSGDRRNYKLKKNDFPFSLEAAVKQIMNNPNIVVPKTETLLDILNTVQHITPNTSKPINTLNGSQISNDSGDLNENPGTNICKLPSMQVENKNRDVENVVISDCKSENILNAITYKTLVDILNTVQQIKPKTNKTYSGDETDNANTQHITVCKLKGNKYREEKDLGNDIKRENSSSDGHDTSVSSEAERLKIAGEKLARLRTMEHVQADNHINNNEETNNDHKYNAEVPIVSSVDTSDTPQNYHINFSDSLSHKPPPSTGQSTDTNKEDCDSKEQLCSITNSVPWPPEPPEIVNRGNHDANNKSDNTFFIKLPLNMLNESLIKALLNVTNSHVNDRIQTNSDKDKYKILNTEATKQNTCDETSNNQSSDRCNKETRPPFNNGEIKNSERHIKKRKLHNLDSSSKIRSKKQKRIKNSRPHHLDENYKNNSSSTTNLELKNKDNNINKMRLVSELLDNKINRTSNKGTKKCNNEAPRNLNTNLVVNDRNDNIQNQMESLRSLNTNLATNDKQNNLEKQTDSQRSLNTSLASASIDKYDKSKKQIDSSEKEKSKHTKLASNSCKSNVIVIDMKNKRASIKSISAPTLETNSTEKSSGVKKNHNDNKRKAFYEADESTIERDLINCIKKLKANCKPRDKPKTIQDSASFKENNVSNSNGNNELPKVKITRKNKIKDKSSNLLKISTGKPFCHFKCPHCTVIYKKHKCFIKHLTENHDVKKVDISKACILMKKCEVCFVNVLAEEHRTHVETVHEDLFNHKVKTNKQN